VNGSRVLALGHYQPAGQLTNHELQSRLDTNDEWITRRVGIKQRHIAPCCLSSVSGTSGRLTTGRPYGTTSAASGAFFEEVVDRCRSRCRSKPKRSGSAYAFGARFGLLHHEHGACRGPALATGG
jgi:hypothetical protein